MQPATRQPLARALVAWNLAEQCDVHPHPGGLSRQNVALGISNVDAFLRRYSEPLSRVQQGSGVRLAFGNCVATHRYPGATPQGKVLQQRFRKPTWLVGDHSPG